MQEPQIPDNEVERLQALRQLAVLDTPPELRFDRITSIAQNLFDMPIVLISLIDSDRQWFKSRQGLEACETPRSISFCGHAILSDDILYIPNVTQDERFADNPLVTGPPFIRAYIGAPLRLASGLRIGTLCLIDCKPRSLTETEVADLRHLADWVQDELQRVLLTDAVKTIRVHEAHLHALLSNVADAILTVDAQACILSANVQTATLFELANDQLIGAPLQKLLPHYPAAQFQDLVRNRALSEAEVLSRLNSSTSGRRSDGEEFPVDMAVTAMDVPGGRTYILSLRDQTKAQQLDRMKHEFVSTVSHELRTPLTAIQGSLGLVAGGVVGPVSEKMLEMLNIATSNCERLIFLVNDILDLEKIELGRMTFTMTSLPIAAVLTEAIELNQSYATQFNVVLKLRCTLNEDVLVNADKDRLIQVLTNLISNAAKFSSPGAVVQVEAGFGTTNDCVRVGVRDQGPGIPKDMRERVFEKFVQVEGAEAQRKGGSGLGLSISKAIVEAFGGKIAVDCPPVGGSLFYLELPVRPD